MTTYSLRCRNSKCRYRRVSKKHPESLKKRYRCPSCNQIDKGWRIEGREYNKKTYAGAAQFRCTRTVKASTRAAIFTLTVFTTRPKGSELQMTTYQLITSGRK